MSPIRFGACSCIVRSFIVHPPTLSLSPVLVGCVLAANNLAISFQSFATTGTRDGTYVRLPYSPYSRSPPLVPVLFLRLCVPRRLIPVFPYWCIPVHIWFFVPRSTFRFHVSSDPGARPQTFAYAHSCVDRMRALGQGSSDAHARERWCRSSSSPFFVSSHLTSRRPGFFGPGVTDSTILQPPSLIHRSRFEYACQSSL